jgi:hypothetical protein
MRATDRKSSGRPTPSPEILSPGPGRRGCVEGCAFEAPHAGRHGEPYRPTTTSCAPLRCYCGLCPSWRPRVPPAPPVADPELVAELVAPVREAIAAAGDPTPAQRRARAERAARRRREDQPWRAG